MNVCYGKLGTGRLSCFQLPFFPLVDCLALFSHLVNDAANNHPHRK